MTMEKNKFPSADKASLIGFYGNPDANADGRPDLKWEVENIVRIKPAFPMFWSWSMQPVKSIAIHKKCAESLSDILADIGRHIHHDDIARFQIDRCGGGYNFRPMRGLNSLSVHSYGAAIDLSPEINAMGVKYGSRRNMIPQKVVDIFAAHGWGWGGLWKRPDAMHFQATK